EQADPLHPALRSRRHHRHRRPQSRAAAERKLGRIGAAGESSGRRRHGRRRRGRALGARRLYDTADGSRARLQSDAAIGYPYDLFKGLQAVSIVGSSPAVIVASLTLPVKTFSEFIAYAKANPGKLNFASAGVGTAPHLAGEMIKLAAGIEMTHVPYRGIGAAYPDVMSGKVQLAFSSIAGAVPFTAANRVRPIATTGSARSAVYPDVPTVAESGLPGFDVDLWIGIYAPAGLPPAVLAKLNGEINKVLQHPELKAAFAKIGIAPRGTSPEQAAAFTRAEYEK